MLVFPSRTSMFFFSELCAMGLNTDARRTKHCWQNYVDYYKCVEAKGEEFRPCTQVSIPAF